MRYLIILSLFLFSTSLHAQYANMDMGLMRVNYKGNGIIKDSWWSGFNVNVAGFTFARYGGIIGLRDSFPGPTEEWLPQGNFYQFGYTKTFTNIMQKDVEEDMKTPVFVPYVGVGFGGWRTHNINTMLTLNINAGCSVNLWRNIAFYAGFNSGVKLFKRWFEGPWWDPVIPNVVSSIPTFYAHMNFGLRMHYSIGNSIAGISSSKEYFHSPGWYSYQYESGGWIYSGKQYSEGGSFSDYAVLITNEIISAAPVVYFTRGVDGAGITRALGGKITARTGLINADLQYMRGRVGMMQDENNPLDMNYWKMSQASIGIGINAFNVFAPFKGPSVYRFLFGYRLGITSMETVSMSSNAGIFPPAPVAKNKFTRNFFISAEFGRFGLSWDYYKSKEIEAFKSSGTLSAYYMIPLVRN